MNNETQQPYFEGSLREVLRTYRTGLDRGSRDFWASFAVFVASACLAIWSLGDVETNTRLFEVNGDLAAISIGLSSSGLGIILAGFSLVASAIDPKTFDAMSKVKNKNNGLPEINFFYSIFVNMLALLLGLFFVSLLYYIFSSGPVAHLLEYWLPTASEVLVDFFFFPFLVGSLVYVLMSFVSFLRNLHIALLLLGQFRKLANQNEKASAPEVKEQS